MVTALICLIVSLAAVPDRPRVLPMPAWPRIAAPTAPAAPATRPTAPLATRPATRPARARVYSIRAAAPTTPATLPVEWVHGPRSGPPRPANPPETRLDYGHDPESFYRVPLSNSATGPVRGHTRRDGTYVQPHTRRRSRR